MPRKFRTKPVTVLAIQVTPNNIDHIVSLVRGSHYHRTPSPNHGYHYSVSEDEGTEHPQEEHCVIFPTKFGLAKVCVREWIAFDENNNHYPFTDKDFWAHHEVVEEDDDS